MKKIIKVLGIIIISIIVLFCIYITEESLRLKSNNGALPLIITDQTKYSISAIKPGEEVKIEYKSFGYKLIVRYTLSEQSSEDNKIISIIGEEFWLFNKTLLWGWIS